jgi:tRNA pseudouridine38-40 synthase
MPRYRLLIEYDGRPYCGYQAQAGLPSVQGTLEAAITGFCGEDIRVHAAGRTDTGVHATGQVVHVDLTRDWPVDTVRKALNAHLMPHPVCVLQADLAPEGWHARFSATERRYRYRILSRQSPPALDQGRVWYVRKPLDAEAMHDAAQALVGHHDFTTFRDLACQARSPIKTLDVATVRREGDEVILDFASRSFLHRQVRSMTGTLAQVGVGRWRRADVAAALAARDRKACGPVAPPDGLYLTYVGYEPAPSSTPEGSPP